MTDDDAVETLRAIAHPLRLTILKALSQAERNVGEIEEATGIGQPALSQQLSVLRRAELVETRKHAKLVFYSLDGARVGEIAGLVAALAGQGAPADSPADPASQSASRSASRSASLGAAQFARLS